MSFRVRIDRMCQRAYLEIDTASAFDAEVEALQLALEKKVVFEDIPYEQGLTATIVKATPDQKVN